MVHPMHLRMAFLLVLAAGFITPALTKDRNKEGRQDETDLAKPILLELPLKETDTPLFPFVGDFDGDGRQDFLLGAPGGGEKGPLLNEDGRLRVFLNVGTKTKPRLAAPRGFDKWTPTSDIPRG
jgi:hypothetical protein